MKPKSTIYLLASEEAFAIYKGEGPRSLHRVGLRTAASLGDVDHGFRSEGARGQAGPGRAQFEVGIEASRTKALERAALAQHAVAALERAWAAADAERIVIAAGPKMLGALRAAMPKALAAQVAGELHKDLLGLPEHELAQHLGGGA